MFSYKDFDSQALAKQLDSEILPELKDYLSKYALVSDSRYLKSKDIFCAYPGTISDGRDYINQAIKANISFLLWERSGANPLFISQLKASNIPNLAVTNLQLLMGILAAYKYNHPSSKFPLIGVTGTNGKTSVSTWIAQASKLMNTISGLIGTNGYGVYPEIIPTQATTPDPLTLQRILDGFHQDLVARCVMEVSSHALNQGRVNGIDFRVAVFTNLTLDHLDYHKTMEAYYQSKRKLFYWQNLKFAIINYDDEYGAKLIKELATSRPELNIISYGLRDADIQAKDIRHLDSSTEFSLVYLGSSYKVSMAIVGLFNVYNILAMVATLISLGHDITKIVAILGHLTPVTGRMQVIKKANKPLVIVDFAHTPDALSNVLDTLRLSHRNAKICCVFGCGGDRDTSKRAIMGAISTKLADQVIITSDNPRTEDPSRIANDIALGADRDNYQIILDRKQAIDAAIKSCNRDDVVLIAGKGHENYQIIGSVKYDFSDINYVESIL